MNIKPLRTSIYDQQKINFRLFFSESATADERNKIKYNGKSQKLTNIFLKQLYSI